MRSKITIDIDENNNAVIVLDYVRTDDVRDKLVQSFIEGFQHKGTKASVEFTEIEDFDSPFVKAKKKRLIFRPTTES